MCTPPALKFWGSSTNEDEQKYLYMLSTKTQFAGRDIHKIVILLLRYISKKYLSEFNLIDEGKYWETGDEKILNENFDRYEELLDSFSFAFENVPINENESIEDYLYRIIKIVSQKKKNKPEGNK